jgi:ribulose-phosphate 3-epimerase
VPLTTIAGRPILLAPSLLAADFARLGEHVAEATAAGADWLHVDVMDGVFVPNISIGLPVVAALRSITSLPLDCHLMIVNPERYIDAFVDAGATSISVHVETCPHLNRTLEQIRDRGARPGVVLNPATPLVMLDDVLDLVDLVLIMSVNPGFGGQRYSAGATARIARLRRQLDERSLGHVHLQVDGGINAATAPAVVAAGATNLVAGSAVFNHHHSVAESVAQLRSAVQQAV